MEIRRRSAFTSITSISVTPNSTLDTTISTNTNGITNINIISADSSVASSVSLDEEEESPTKIKKKDNPLVMIKLLFM